MDEFAEHHGYDENEIWEIACTFPSTSSRILTTTHMEDFEIRFIGPISEE